MLNVLVLSATAFEQGALREKVEQRVVSAVAGKEWVSGRVGGRSVLLVATGIGAGNAAHALTCALQARRPDCVLQVGVGGAYPRSGLGIGDVALASEEWYGDLGVRTDEGWQGADIIGIPVYGDDGYNKFDLGGECLDRAKDILPEVKVGAFATVQECSGTDELGNEREALFGAVCENMEGAAAAHVCALYGVPFLEVRAMSNRVEKREREKWDLMGAVARAQDAAARLLEGGI